MPSQPYAPKLEEAVTRYNRLVGVMNQELKLVQGAIDVLNNQLSHVNSAMWSGDREALGRVWAGLESVMRSLEDKYLKRPAAKQQEYEARVRAYVTDHSDTYTFYPSVVSKELKLPIPLVSRVFDSMPDFKKTIIGGKVIYNHSRLIEAGEKALKRLQELRAKYKTPYITRKAKKYEGNLGDAVRMYIRVRSRRDEFDPVETAQHFGVPPAPVFRVYRSIDYLKEKTIKGRTKFVRIKKK